MTKIYHNYLYTIYTPNFEQQKSEKKKISHIIHTDFLEAKFNISSIFYEFLLTKNKNS